MGGDANSAKICLIILIKGHETSGDGSAFTDTSVGIGQSVALTS